MENEEKNSEKKIETGNPELTAEAQESMAQFGEIGDPAEIQAASLNAIFEPVDNVLSSTFNISNASDFLKKIYEIRSAFRAAEKSVAVFAGSTEKAAAFMKELQEYAGTNSFEFSDLAEGSIQLLSFRTSIEEVIPVLDRLSGIAAATRQPLSDYIDLYTQARMAGELDARALDAWADKGVFIVDTLKEIGIETRNSGVGFEELETVLSTLTGYGGAFAGAMQAQMEGLSGSWNKLQKEISGMLNEIGENLQQPMEKGMEWGSALVTNYETVGKTIVGLIATYGTYRAALLVANTVMKEQAAIQAVIAASNGVFNRTLAYQWVWTDRLQRTQAFLNRTMMANPYVVLATAVAGLGAAVWALYDGTTAEEKAQKRLNDRLQEAKEKKENLLSASQTWVDKIKDENATIYEQIRALDELKKEFPEVFGNFSLDELKGLSRNEINIKINVGVEDRELEDAKKEVAKLQGALNDANEKINFLGKQPSLNGGGNAIGYYSKQANELSENLKTAQSHLDEIENRRARAEFEGKSPEEKRSHYEKELDALKQQEQQLQALIDKSKELKAEWSDTPWSADFNKEQLRVVRENIQEKEQQIHQTYPEEQKSVRNKQYWEDKRSKAQKERDELADFQEGSEDWLALTQIIEEATKKLEIYNATAGKAGKQAGENREKTKTELDEALKKSAYLVEVSQLSRMEGVSKKLQQIELDKQQALGAIEKEEEALKKKYREVNGAELPDEMRKGFSIRKENTAKQAEIDKATAESEHAAYLEGVYKNLGDVFLSEEQRKIKSIEERYRKERAELQKKLTIQDISSGDYEKFEKESKSAEERELNKLLIAGFGDYYQKRAELAAEWEKTIAGIPLEYQEKAKKQRDKELADLDNSMSNTSGLWGQLFEDMAYKSAGRIKAITENAKEILDYLHATPADQIEGSVGGLTAEQLRDLKENTDKLTEAYTKLNDIQQNQDESPVSFISLINSVKSYRDACADAKKMQDELLKAQQKVESERTKLSLIKVGKETGLYSEDDLKKQNAGLKEAQKNLTNIQNRANASSENVSKNLSKIFTASQAVAGSMSEIGKIFTEMGEAFDNTVFENIGNALSLIGDTAGKLMKGDYIGAIAGIISSWVQSSAKHKEALKEIREAEIAYQRKYNQVLHETTMLMEEFINIFGSDKINMAQEYFKQITIKLEEFQQRAKGNKTEKDFYRWGITSEGKIERVFQEEEWKKYQNLEEQDLGALYDARVVVGQTNPKWYEFKKKRDVYSSLLDVYPKLITNEGEFDATVAQTILDTRKVDDHTKNLLEDLIQTTNQINEAKEALTGYLQDTFGILGDSLGDAIVKAFEDGGDAMEIWKQDFSNVLKDLGKQIMYSVYFKKMFDELEEDLLEIYGKKQKPEELGAEVTALLGTFFNRMEGTVKEAENFYKEWVDQAEKAGIDLSGGGNDTFSQDSTTGGFQTITQDQAGELNGRFTALVECSVRIEGALYGIAAVQVESNSIMQSISFSLTDFQPILLRSMYHLQDIADYTSVLPEMVSIVKEFRQKGIKMI